TQAFNGILNAFGLPQRTDIEKTVRREAIQAATRFAIEIPFEVLQTSYASMQVMMHMAQTGNPNSVSDAGVGALAARSAVLGAALNVKINAIGLTDKDYTNKLLQEVAEIEQKTVELEGQILEIVNRKIGIE
nr:cyclodeaminase/cyclohydrolase family protein [Paludibacter sp.]